MAAGRSAGDAPPIAKFAAAPFGIVEREALRGEPREERPQQVEQDGSEALHVRFLFSVAGVQWMGQTHLRFQP